VFRAGSGLSTGSRRNSARLDRCRRVEDACAATPFLKSGSLDAMTEINPDEAFEREGRVNVDMEPEELLRLMLSTDLREPVDESRDDFE
jgi:hypothetical protein